MIFRRESLYRITANKSPVDSTCRFQRISSSLYARPQAFPESEKEWGLVSRDMWGLVKVKI